MGGGGPKLEQIKNLNSVNGDNQASLSFVSVCGDGGAAQEVLAPPLVPARLRRRSSPARLALSLLTDKAL